MIEEEEHHLVLKALAALYAEDSMWRLNFYNFNDADFMARHRWWYLAKKQAELGAPAMQTLLFRVLKLRITDGLLK
jgi:hypothetical protein